MVALVEELARVRGHGFLLGEAAVWAGQHRFKNNSAHRSITFEQWTDSLQTRLTRHGGVSSRNGRNRTLSRVSSASSRGQAVANAH